jgi:hypothetical protein
MALIKLNNQSLSAVTSAGLPSGSIIGVTTSRFTGTASTNVTTFAGTGHTITVTPSSTASKLMIFNLGGAQTWSQSTNLRIRLYRKIGTGSFTDITGDIGRIHMNTTYQVPVAFSYTDSPATTSAVTYEVYIASGAAGSQIWYNGTELDKRQELTVMEIAG